MKCSINETCHRFFSALANPTRLSILETLQASPKNVAELASILKQEQSMISHNLKPLEDCAFVFSERQGRTRVYRLNKELIDRLLELFCFHANKYCPEERACLTDKGFERRKKEEAEKELYINRE